MNQNDPCRLCGAHGLVPVYAQPYGMIVRCAHCGIVLLGTPQTQEFIQRAQQEAFGGDWVEARLRHSDINSQVARRRWKEIRRHVSGGRLLEIGCASGELLALAARDGFQVAGVDSSPKALEAVRGRLGLRELYGSLDAVGSAPGPFDVVVMSHILEHLYDPADRLRRIHSLLRPGGLLYLAVPNLDDWGRYLLGADWPAFLPVHATYFTFQTLAYLLKRTGFLAMHLNRSGPPTIAFSVLWFIKAKILHRTAALPDTNANPELSSTRRLTIRVLRLGARLTLGALGLLLYPIGLLQVHLGKTNELVVVVHA